MVLQTNPPQEAHDMLSRKIRTSLITLVATLGVAGASIIPSAAQAQWHNYCTGGHCITHTNFTIGGVSPCVAVSANADKAYEGLLEALQNQKDQEDKVHAEQSPTETREAVEDAEARVHSSELASFEWGCSTAKAATVTLTKVPVAVVGAFKASVRRATSPSFHLRAHEVIAAR
jgi:hypothetical protein